MNKFFIRFLTLILLFATVLPSMTMAQETNLDPINNNIEEFNKPFSNSDLNEIKGENEIQPRVILAPIFRVVLQAGKYLSTMNRTGKVIKSTRSVVATEAHIFSKKHIELGILKLGTNRQSIINSGVNVISRVDDLGYLKKGHNQIFTTINGHPAEIRVFVDNYGKLESFDMFYRTANIPKAGANLILH